ncbi:hypothetical protein BT96DRAFT_951726 [Gymnopus androsaceus JB14]|uniref:Uncharacterized protein n=1 Tax=Gymnopus androsaceus JB14 TaxID=1447944 RepID=A0A6A4GC44_9AGAR|nr:hypothetical protein BT96DRAFT_951726 [Gymnopus androsaceus JB14]
MLDEESTSTSSLTMMGEFYEVGFIRSAIRVDEKLWAGWKVKDETNEPATSIAFHGEAFNRFWYSFKPEEIYKTIKHSVTLKKELVKKYLKDESKQLRASKQFNPGPIQELPPSNLSSDGQSTLLEIPYPDTMVVDPQVLWLPPDRIGQATDDPKVLYKIVVNALESRGINGYQFYLHLKRDRKEYGQKWFEQQQCASSRLLWPMFSPALENVKGNLTKWYIKISVGPCCRQIGYLISKEWVFAQNEEARNKHKKQYRMERNQARKDKAKVEKMAAQDEIEEATVPILAQELHFIFIGDINWYNPGEARWGRDQWEEKEAGLINQLGITTCGAAGQPMVKYFQQSEG